MNNEFEVKKQKLKNMFCHVSDSIHIYGIENIPSDGITIFVANHHCFLDIFLVPYAIMQPCISLISSNSLFGTNIERKEKLNDLLYPFPVETRAGEHYTDTCLDGTIDLLSHGKNLIIFPQGVFCKERKVLRARTGVSRILFDTLKQQNIKINLVPIALNVCGINSDNIQSSDVWKDFNASITFLPKFDYSNYYNDYINCNIVKDRNQILHNMMDDIMKSIANHLKFEFEDKYGALYDMDGFWFPDGKYVKFDEA